ncbi:hypothetical protein GCM10022211_06650 [Sphingomonas humi]|uniref:Uncharacterized protein n=1 Tax=Sphingomonas humi TaxID=335630 RepID=A0ABP7RLN7_9SPHN
MARSDEPGAGVALALGTIVVCRESAPAVAGDGRRDGIRVPTIVATTTRRIAARNMTRRLGPTR